MTRRQGQTGSALIEFAGSLILLSTLLTGIFQLGYTFYAYQNLVNAVRAGGRYASLAARGPAASDPEFVKSVRNMVVYGEPRPGAAAKPIVPGLKAENVELVLRPAAATVSVRGYQIDALFTRVNLDGRPTVTFPIAKGTAQ